MKFEDIQWQPGDKVQDNLGDWWTFIEGTRNEEYPLRFDDENGFGNRFTRKGWFISYFDGDKDSLHLLPETYKPIKDIK